MHQLAASRTVTRTRDDKNAASPRKGTLRVQTAESTLSERLSSKTTSSQRSSRTGERNAAGAHARRGTQSEIAPTRRREGVSSASKRIARARCDEHRRSARNARWARFGISVGAIAVCLILAALIIYPNAKSCYTAWRDNQNVNAEYTAVQSRNDTIQTRVNDLSTDEGIEDRAREEYGWVKSGENAVNVTGVNADEATSVLPKTVEQGSVTADTDWFIDELDAFFGYEYTR